MFGTYYIYKMFSYMFGWDNLPNEPLNIDGGEDENVKVMTEKVEEQIKKVNKEILETEKFVEKIEKKVEKSIKQREQLTNYEKDILLHIHT